MCIKKGCVKPRGFTQPYLNTLIAICLKLKYATWKLLPLMLWDRRIVAHATSFPSVIFNRRNSTIYAVPILKRAFIILYPINPKRETRPTISVMVSGTIRRSAENM